MLSAELLKYRKSNKSQMKLELVNARHQTVVSQKNLTWHKAGS